MSTNPLRQQILDRPDFSVDRFAQAQGFPSAAALEAVIAAGVSIRRDGQITDAVLASALKHYDPALHNQVRQAVAHVNQVAKQHGALHGEYTLIAAVVGTDPQAVEDSRSMIGNYMDAEIAQGILDKRAPLDEAPEQRPQEINSIRANLLRETRSTDPRLPTEILADAAEKVLDKREALEAAPSLYNLREHVASAMDTHLVTDTLEDISDASELSSGVEPQGA